MTGWLGRLLMLPSPILFNWMWVSDKTTLKQDIKSIPQFPFVDYQLRLKS